MNAILSRDFARLHDGIAEGIRPAECEGQFFLELGWALRWAPSEKILMLWGYFDESGLHGPDGKLRKLTLGGCLAPREAWDRLSIDWAAAMKEWNIPVFHMTDFEARRHPYDKWTAKQRKDRLNTLLDMIGAAKAHCYSFTNPIRPGDDTAKIYERCAHVMFYELGMSDEEFSIVFAHHPEYGRQEELYAKIIERGMRDYVSSCTVGKPIKLEPLQAADIVAYEMCRNEREDGRPQRYPITRLFDLGCTFRASGAVD